MNTQELDGRTVLITGAGSGIGRSHAQYLSTRGASIIVQDINADGAEETIAVVRGNGGRATGLVCDVRDALQFKTGIERLASEFGSIDVLVNNVGIPGDCTIEDCTEEQFEDVFAVNVFSFIVALQSVLPQMKDRRFGKVINTSSNWGLTGQQNSCLYSAAKAAILGLTKSWARELAPWNINVNCVAPGGVNTRLLHADADRLSGIPLKRYAEPLDISRVVEFLASDGSNYMTGCVLNVTGGELITGC